MGRTVLKKLNSSKGASITFALLAFLVCAVISAVLLASASASAGRLSGLAAADQRYYAVTSAAQLFCDTLDGQSFTIEQTHTEHKKVTSYYKYEEGIFRKESPDTTEDGTPPVTYDLKIKAPYDIDDTTEAYSGDDLQELTTTNSHLKGNSLLTEAALYYVFGDTSRLAESVTVDTFVNKTFAGGTETHAYTVYPTWNMTLTVSGKDSLSVTVEGKMSANGDIELKFRNKTTGDDVDIFSMIIVLHADIRESQVTLPERTEGSGSSLIGGDLRYSSWVETAQDTVKTTVITWRVSEVKKVAA